MKKFFGSFLIVVIVLLVSLAAVPWNNISQWGVSLPVLTNYEMYIKGGIAGIALIVSLIYLLIANSEYNNYNYVNRNTARTAFLPLYIFSISILIYGGLLNYYIYTITPNTTNLLIVGFFGVVALTMMVYGHIFANTFREESNGKRIAHFIFLFELAVLSAGITFWFYTYKVTNYASMDSYYFALVAAVGIVLYILHIIFTSVGKKRHAEEEELESEIQDIEQHSNKPSLEPQTKRKTKKGQETKTFVKQKDGKKTMIVSNSQTIVSSENNFDPTNMIYEDVTVDPEFTKTTAASNAPNSIEYYIEKPKMFKPLDPTFDQLVAYVRELPQVVTKLDDDRITFYVDRKPFLVLMNLGNYYRIAFKYDLEKGIRLIIKYPTISKNKSTRDELWFKANNYGDIPKDVVYQIVKSSYDSINF